jgi:DNA-binding beta-propeller fold protein YncE
MKRDLIGKPYIFNFMKAEHSGELPALGIGVFARSCATAIFGALLLLSLPAKADDLYIADYNNNTVERIDSSGHSTVYLDDTVGLDGPMGVAFDGNGNLYVGNWYFGTILKVAPNGQSSLFAYGLDEPRGMACDSAGNLYVAEYGSGRIDKFNPAGQESSLAGLNRPTGVAVGPDGDIYVADQNDNITKFNPSGQGALFVSTGSSPEGLAFDSSGNLYVACYFSQAIYKYNSSGIGGLFASTGSVYGYTNPFGLAFDSSGNLYATCNVNVLNKIDSSGNVSFFANTLPGPWFIAVKPVPEPSPWAILIFGGSVLTGYRGCARRDGSLGWSPLPHLGNTSHDVQHVQRPAAFPHRNVLERFDAMKRPLRHARCWIKLSS